MKECQTNQTLPIRTRFGPQLGSIRTLANSEFGQFGPRPGTGQFGPRKKSELTNVFSEHMVRISQVQNWPSKVRIDQDF